MCSGSLVLVYVSIVAAMLRDYRRRRRRRRAYAPTSNTASTRSLLACSQASTGIDMTCKDAFSSGVDMNNWTHVAVTCEQDNRVKAFFNGEITNITTSSGNHLPHATPPKETFFIHYFDSPVIMDLHILGFALPRDEIYDLYRG